MSGADFPSFFVPHVAPEKAEECYAELARSICRAVPAIGERIYSITYSHNGETWTATVGDQLRGQTTKTSKVGGRKVERVIPLSNGPVVMAIFPGVPFHVWHDGTSRTWANPFLTRQPQSIRYFSA